MKHTLFILALITATIQTFAQSPRIKLNQITKDSVTGSVLISSPTDSGMVYSRDLFISYGADTVLILGGDTLAATSSIISSVLSDGVTITGDGTTGSELTVDTATVIATKQDLDLYYLDSNPDGYTSNTGTVTSVAATAGTGISVSGSPITTSGTLTITNTAPDQTVSIAGGGINAVTGTYPSFTVTGTEVDGSISNEGSLTVGAGTASTSVISSNTSGSTDVTLTAGTNVTLSESGNNITISSTGGGTTYNNISETVDTVYIDSYLNVDNGTLYVDSTNNRVGIGTSSPSKKLTIYDDFDGQDGIELLDASGGFFRIAQATGNPGEFTGFMNGQAVGNRPSFILRGTQSSSTPLTAAPLWLQVAKPTNDGLIADTSKAISFFNWNIELMTVMGNGNVGIGTTSPAEKLHIVGNIVATGTITPSYSDANLKTNIIDLQDGLNVILDLKPKTFNFISDNELGLEDDLIVGLVAQDVEQSLSAKPYLNSVIKQIGEYKAIDVHKIIPITVKAIQEQQAIIESQASEIEALKTLITELSNRLQILENN